MRGKVPGNVLQNIFRTMSSEQCHQVETLKKKNFTNFKTNSNALPVMLNEYWHYERNRQIHLTNLVPLLSS